MSQISFADAEQAGKLGLPPSAYGVAVNASCG